ncbi:S-layer homology domain-containing protein [Demequina sp. SYSU T00039]|uniref:S-layer homology domain-containing protein n=1 Tax=Demequina lignilytica TaxID=3051663 RepID=A0AAW7M7P8_9MICO|nr:MULTISPECIES: S-layer homology domain-containing protein [unclassified Demequina]MDN4477879.1 S-layer homology domain-containing protein [Demequina sp. SYSU T00039-1]MDN4487788.1 S-layer homology domain-containing protein [Demequina sp. SYSU T00039]
MTVAVGSRLTVLVLGLATLVAVLAPAQPAAALVTDGFDRSMIISDALFYDSDAMTAKEIQAFLDEKVPECEPERDADPDDIVCLKDYVTEFAARDAAVLADGTVLCKAISARTGVTAAKVIDIVARACGVSQKVILVTLQKEQGLVTNTYPSSWRYRSAMGYGCPDSGTCAELYYGFFNQVYNAAKQFKRYQANPTSYGHVAGRTTNLKIHPANTTATASCTATIEVVIKNQATAGLYNYTPYTPNAAALAAGWGTGDTCSSYGNRNFYNYYTTWFGPTTGYPVAARFASTYESHGGADVLGAALTAGVRVDANGGGWYQRFSNGTLYQTADGIFTYVPNGSIATAYKAAGGPGGAWGWPIADRVKEDGVNVIEFREVRAAYVGGTVVVGYPFADVSANAASNDYSEHAEAIFWMASSGLSTGWDTTEGVVYRPLSRITRDAMAAFLYRYTAPDYSPPGSSSFIDVTTTSSFFAEIEWLASTGVSTGWSTSAGAEYRPLSNITRDAMAAFLYRLAAPEDYVAPTSSPFVDVTPSHPFYTEICWLAETGISTGWNTSAGAEYRPGSTIGRDAMAAFLYRFDQLDG